ncbi:hypothetical protein [Aurantibacillus circumpalustris]|uniref:hypothetical protein n=1 Tax=Aurantibacillus circumpalustris TaxID=3036359 RepID=UPI00295AFA85|nr:hypothetical protein [Aurantibacillus circumpalustris]
MKRFLQISLLLNSLLAIALVSCSPASGHKFIRTEVVTTNEVQPIIDQNNSLLYKAKIDLFRNHFSGLIVLKQIDSSTSHLTFITEIGMKMFDYEIRDTSFNLVYVFEPLNKPKILNLLKSDMKLILLQHLFNKQADLFEKNGEKVYKVKDNFRYYYVLNKGAKTVKTIKKKSALCTKVKTFYFYSNTLQANQIDLKHKGLIRLKIKLNNINKQ